MYIPTKIEIEYLVDAAEKTFFEDHIPKLKLNTSFEVDIPRYVPYIFFKKAQNTLLWFGHAENTEDLKDRISVGLARFPENQECPADYKENGSVIQVLLPFYVEYDENWGLSANFQDQETEGSSETKEKILTTSKALRTALKMLSRVERGDTSEEAFIQANGIPEEFLQDTEYDGRKNWLPAEDNPERPEDYRENEPIMLTRVERGETSEEDFIRENGVPEQFLEDTKYDEEGFYNIIPFDGRTNWLPAEVKHAIKELKLAGDALFHAGKGDVLDCLQKFFGFQKSSVSNQREHIVNLLSNEQMRLCTPGEHNTVFNEALENVFLKSLDNYIKWCSYLPVDPIWKNMDVISEEKNVIGNENNVISKEKKILYISLYYLIWGEAANVRFLPECLCYIFHRMGKRLDKKDVSCNVSFMEEVICPLYEVIAAEAKINKDRDASHSKWRNYDDINEYFWSPNCLQLGWPLNRDSPFFQKPKKGSTVYGKTSFVEHRTIWHLYHSFHRMWIFHVMMFQALVIFAFNDGKLNAKTLREILSVGPTYFLMKLIQSTLDIVLKYGAYSNTSLVDVLRILFRFIWFMLATLFVFFIGMKCLQEKTSSVEESIVFKVYIAVLVILFSTSCLSKRCEKSFVAHLIKWINQEEYVGRGMDEKPTDYIKYMIFWIVTLAINFAFTYYGLIMPLVRPTRDITDVSKSIHNMLAIGSLWAGVICAYIVGSHISYNVISAFVGTFVGHRDRLGNIKFLGDFHKCFDRIPAAFIKHLRIPPNIRESRTENEEEDVKKKRKLVAAEFTPFWNQIVMNLREEDYISDSEQYALSMPENKTERIDVVRWPPFLLVGKVSGAIKIAAKSVSQEVMWNEIKSDVYMKYAVEECFQSVKFVLSSVLDDEGRMLVEGICSNIENIARDGNLCSEFQLNQLESFVIAITGLIEFLHMNVTEPAQRSEDANAKLNGVIQHDFLNEFQSVLDYRARRIAGEMISDFIWPTDPVLRSEIERLYSLLTKDESADFPKIPEARRRLEFFTNSLFMSMPTTKPVREMLSFSVLTPYYEETVLYSLDEVKKRDDAGDTDLLAYLKKLYPDEWSNYCERLKRRSIVNPEEEDLELRLWASYRGQTLARTVRGTMYNRKALLLQAYIEGVDGQPSTSCGDETSASGSDVSMDEGTRNQLGFLVLRHGKGKMEKKSFIIKLLNKENYNQWKHQMEVHLETEEMTGFINGSLRDPDPKGESQEGQSWKQLDKLVMDWIIDSLDELLHDSVKEIKTAKQMWDALKENFGSQGLNECFDKAKAYVDLKFTYVVSCQKYGEQKRDGKDVAADIAFLLKRNEGLRVAYIDEDDDKTFYSKLLKADKNGKETEVYSIKLPGDPILGEGKPENQNHAIVFTRGNAIQTIDMNQDNYFEETLKMRNLLEEFHRKDGTHPPTILGIREHIFTGSASYLASFMSNQETSFVTLGQRVMAKPLNVRMHYGHPDVFDRVFHITRGGISKASRGINISEDIYAGFNSTLRNGRVTHHEYIQVGKGRDVGFNQIAIFEGKVAGGNGEQVLSRDIYRLGQRFDFFRMLSFYYTTIGYYFSSLLMVITLYILLYGNLIMALSGTRVPHALNDTNLTIRWLLVIVLLPSIYMVLVLILEQGYKKAVASFLSMFSRFCSIFFAFSLGTRNHWFGRTIIHGGASYQATGRGFVLDHIKFSENYRRYSRSHFVKGMEVLFLLVVYGIYGFHQAHAFYNNLLLLGGLILSISWIVAPFLFDSSPFDNIDSDWRDWKDWLNYKSEIVEVKVEESWEVWWNKELSHIRTPTGRVIETILCLRFFIFLYVVIYKIYVQGSIKSLLICGLFWILFMVILFAYEVLSNTDPVNVSWFLQVIHRNRSVATIGALAIAFFTSHVGDMLALIIAFITTLWGILSICIAWKPTLVTGLAKICDAGMGTLMFNIASMLSPMRPYLVRNMFVYHVFDYLQNSRRETAELFGRRF